MNIREDIIRKWFGMWLTAEDTGITDIFTEDAVYIESWGPEYHGAASIRHWFEEWNTRGNGRTENSHATGMGLYLCSRLCRKLGLGISCKSEKGKYTRMILTFPDSDHNKISEH